MNELTSIYQYIELQVDEANTKLDSDWEEKINMRRGASNINQEHNIKFFIKYI